MTSCGVTGDIIPTFNILLNMMYCLIYWIFQSSQHQCVVSYDMLLCFSCSLTLRYRRSCFNAPSASHKALYQSCGLRWTLFLSLCHDLLCFFSFISASVTFTCLLQQSLRSSMWLCLFSAGVLFPVSCSMGLSAACGGCVFPLLVAINRLCCVQLPL